MAKKRGKRKSKSRKSRRVLRSVRSSRKSGKSQGNYGSKVSLVLKNLGFFLALFLIFIAAYYSFTGEFTRDVLWSGALVTGFISLALFIAYLVFFFLRMMKK